MKTTLDKLLNGRIAFKQPARGHGYRVSVDTLLLASAVKATGTQKILELGCGVGVAMLALAARLPEASITGLELQEPLVELCTKNIALNEFTNRLNVKQGDVTALPHEYSGAFDHVMMNPPYHEEKGHDLSPNQIKAIANTESENADIGAWIKAGGAALKEGGQMAIIHRADRCDEISHLTAEIIGSTLIKPIISRTGKDPKRIIIHATKDKKQSVKTLDPFVLYGEGQDYSKEAENIMRQAAGMD